MSLIAVESDLTPVRDYLSGKGYQVESVRLNQQTFRNLRGYDAFVVTGMSNDFLGRQDTQTKAAIINANGKTPQDVEQELKHIL